MLVERDAELPKPGCPHFRRIAEGIAAALTPSGPFLCASQKTLISIFWRVIAAIGPRLGPAFVGWNLAIVDTLLVFPFLTEPFLASEFCSSIRSRDCAQRLTGIGLANHLGIDIDGSQRGGHQGHYECFFRQELHG
jgi:hypothetical protein